MVFIIVNIIKDFIICGNSVCALSNITCGVGMFFYDGGMLTPYTNAECSNTIRDRSKPNQLRYASEGRNVWRHLHANYLDVKIMNVCKTISIILVN